MSCVAKVRATLTKTDNVGKVNVNFKDKTATLVTKSGSLDAKVAKANLKKAGYTVTGIKHIKPKAKKKSKKGY